MRPIDDSLLTPDERRAEVASILAAGVLRLCARTLPATDAPKHSAPENPAESASSCLEVPAETVLSVHNGYLADFNEVKAMGSATSALRTADQTDACNFWASTGANVLWDRAAIDLSSAQGYELSDNARLMATLNLAIADAIISCWDAKYHFEFWRPVTAIPLADTDGNPATIQDEGWTPLIATPAFPEYTSGHSSASSAAATVLAAYFGEETPFILQSPAAPNWVRYYPSFSAALDEVADARVFAGIHFRTACDDGRVAGSEVADYILENSMGRIHGEGE